MGSQSNKIQKRARRSKYEKRRKTRLKEAASAKKGSAPAAA